MKILLVGEDTEFLQGLSLDLMLPGFAVKTACNMKELRQSLERSMPDLIVFDHVEPLDVYTLNPRESGYAGPLLLLISDGVPTSILDHFHTTNVMKKPLVVELLSTEIRLLAAG